MIEATNSENSVTGNVPVITVDGPSGSGKGTLCQKLADRLGWALLDSGALYRLVGYVANKKGITDQAGIAEQALNLDIEFINDPATGELLSILEGQDVTRDIRTETCGDLASRVAAIPEVRAALLKRQRAFRVTPGLIADGRDMGTVVFPAAPVKIFLEATAEERAKRRYNQLKEKGFDASLAKIFDEISERDERDLKRSSSPLAIAADALVIDSSKLSIDEVFERVLKAASQFI
ncbi:MAG: (d)CMP kinase [Pseudomonadales bacterium]|nr:(d)CMP kinase [Pseudomonadales bacterium]